MAPQRVDTDVVVIGGGIVGCAIAARLSRWYQVCQIERHAQPGQETSSRNSGVIHSGIHLPPTSNKAVFARRGKELMVEYCQNRKLPCEQVGMHIVVARDDFFGLWPETKRLFQMLHRARSQNIRVELVSGQSIRRREPFIHGLFGLFIPDVYIVNGGAVVDALSADAATGGVDQHWSSEVIALRQVGTTWVVTTTTGEITGRAVINAAGLYADRVAALAGFNYQQYYYRGEYYRIRHESNLRLNGLVYPVHQPGKPGLGVHLTRTTDGTMLIGPNAKRVNGPTAYTLDPTPAEHFYNDVKKFLPDLDLAHLAPHPAGIRPKLTDSPGENNFQIVWESTPAPFLNLIGIESPGLTAALAIAEEVDLDLVKRFTA